MKRIPKAIYQTVEEIEARIRAREEDAVRLPPGEPRQSVLKEIAQLRLYAEAKRWVESPGLKRVG
jgi:hypothetical protein